MLEHTEADTYGILPLLCCGLQSEGNLCYNVGR